MSARRPMELERVKYQYCVRHGRFKRREPARAGTGQMSTNAGQNYPRSHITHKGVKASEPAVQARNPEQKVRHFFGCTREEVK